VPASPPVGLLAPAGPVRRRRPRRAELAAVITSVWLTQVPEHAGVVRVLPDAAMDLVLSGGRLVVAGPDTGAVSERLAPGWVLGLQLGPATAAQVIGAPASSCLNGRVDIDELWGTPGRVLREQLAATTSPRAAAALIEDAVAARVTRPAPDPLPTLLRRTFARGEQPDLRRLGVAERQLRRRCVAAFGYPPATLRRIVRFQSFVDAVVADRTAALADLACRIGYSDQSHLSHDVREFSGLTPNELRRLAGHSHRGGRAVEDAPTPR
jgi:AraC-like DNA-binding protein